MLTVAEIKAALSTRQASVSGSNADSGEASTKEQMEHHNGNLTPRSVNASGFGNKAKKD